MNFNARWVFLITVSVGCASFGVGGAEVVHDEDCTQEGNELTGRQSACKL